MIYLVIGIIGFHKLIEELYSICKIISKLLGMQGPDWAESMFN